MSSVLLVFGLSLLDPTPTSQGCFRVQYMTNSADFRGSTAKILVVRLNNEILNMVSSSVVSVYQMFPIEAYILTLVASFSKSKIADRIIELKVVA